LFFEFPIQIGSKTQGEKMTQQQWEEKFLECCDSERIFLDASDSIPENIKKASRTNYYEGLIAFRDGRPIFRGQIYQNDHLRQGKDFAIRVENTFIGVNYDEVEFLALGHP